VFCLLPGVRMTAPMLPTTIHIITADIEEVEEGNKASPVRRRRREAFDSNYVKKDPNE